MRKIRPSRRLLLGLPLPDTRPNQMVLAVHQRWNTSRDMWYTFAANCLSSGMLLKYLFEDAEAATPLMHNVTCACGMLVSVLGFLGHRRIWRELTRSDEMIVRMEGDARIEPRRSVSRDRNGRTDALHLRRTMLTRYMGAGASVVAVVAWAVVWIYVPTLGR